MADATKRAVLVLGMHRSGTSALTRIVNLMGFAAPRTLMAATDANEAGFWESEAFMLLNERIMKACGGKWTARRAFSKDPLAVARAGGLYAEVRATLEAEYGDAPDIVLKDPRISRLMAIYRPLLEEAGYRILPVLALRNPMEVAASLTKRDGFSTGKGLGIWLRYTLDAEAATRDMPRAVVGFEALMADWRGTMARAADGLGTPWPDLPPEATAECDATLQPRLRHHVLPPPQRSSWRGFLAREAYEGMLRLAANPHEAGACRKLDRVSGLFSRPL